MNSKVCT